MGTRVTERDGGILHWMKEDGMLTTAVLQQHHFPDQSDEAMKSTLKRLRRTPHIQSEKLYAGGNEVYYILAPAGAKHVDAPESLTHPIHDNDKRGRVYGQML